MNIFNYTIEQIDDIIESIIKIDMDEYNASKNELYSKYNICNMYYAGASLCIDIKDPILNELDVLIISYNNETYGFFSDKTKRLLSLKSLRNLEIIMKRDNIWFNRKNKLCVK